MGKASVIGRFLRDNKKCMQKILCNCVHCVVHADYRRYLKYIPILNW